MLLYRKLINKLHSEKHDIKLNNKQTKKLPSIELDKADWMLIEAIARVLQPFVQATKLISGRKHCTIGVSFFSLVQIREFLEDGKSSTSNDSRIPSRLKQLLLFYMEQYFEKDRHQWHLIKVMRFLMLIDPLGYGVLNRLDRRLSERELQELQEQTNNDVSDTVEDETIGSSLATANRTAMKLKESCMAKFLNSIERSNVSSSFYRRSHSKTIFSEELTAYRSLVQKQYNDTVNCDKYVEAVRKTLTTSMPSLFCSISS